ncbi:MAG: TonB family protein [Campylobacterota bacterium]|nr:TonB family protein [Campylobacterota bacterium]
MIENDSLKFNTTTKTKDTKRHGYTNIKYVKLINKDKKIVQKIKKKKLIQKETIKEKSIKKKKIVKKRETVKKVIVKKEIKKIQKSKVKKQIDLKRFFTIDKSNIIKSEENNLYEKKRSIEKELKEISKLDQRTQSYLKLYGDEYFLLSKEEKRFLKTNLSRIGQITQRHLKYPAISIRTRQKGINMVEFMLHNNGDISNLMITDGSGYTALDQNTIRTIKIAYKDYPKPYQEIKIRIYVRYIMY